MSTTEAVFRIILFIVTWRLVASIFKSYNKAINELNKRMKTLETQNDLYIEFIMKLNEILNKSDSKDTERRGKND
nr:MAG TPA: hypothetical protein [Caudoviricetes sp.]